MFDFQEFKKAILDLAEYEAENNLCSADDLRKYREGVL